MYDPSREYLEHKAELDNVVLSTMAKGDYINGQAIKDLETKLSLYTGSKFVATCGNGTDALFIALKALNIGPGDKVLTVALTWISSAEVISMTGARPVWVDVKQDTFCINEDLIEEKIDEHVKAIICVSLYGFMPDYEKIWNIALKHGIYVIEDGAQSFGSSRMDSKNNTYKSCSNAYTHISTTSFFPTKPLGCAGDGGCMFTNSEELYKKLYAIKSHGGLERFKHEYIGLNSRLDTIQASILLTKFKWLTDTLFRRAFCANKYNEKLDHFSNIFVLPKTWQSFNSFAQYSILVKEPWSRNDLFEHLKSNGINVALFYPIPLYKQKCFQDDNSSIEYLPVTEEICNRIINLPCYGWLKDEEMEFIVNCIINWINKNM